MPRQYQMTNRAAAKERTRAAILEAALAQFTDSWFDEVTIADIAHAAGVSQQTVLNHFGGKMALYLAGLAEIVAPRIRATRARARPGDVGSVVDAVLADYEESGDSTVRTEALALRDPELAEVVAGGRRAHRDWIEAMFSPQLAGRSGAARHRLVTLLALALSASTWHQLCRQEQLGPRQVRRHLLQLVEGVLASVEG
jgi:AcrR family transcriptional regulator